jgi:hypothetical protein
LKSPSRRHRTVRKVAFFNRVAFLAGKVKQHFFHPPGRRFGHDVEVTARGDAQRRGVERAALSKLNPKITQG